MSHDAVTDYVVASGLVLGGLALPTIADLTEWGGFVVMLLGLAVGFIRLYKEYVKK